MDGTVFPSLLPAERAIVAAAERGDRFDLTGKPDDRRRVRARVLRDLLLALPVVPEAKSARPCQVRLPGVRVSGALIDCPLLDLADCYGSGGGWLPALALEDCDISAVVDLSNSRLARLSLKGSRISEVRLRSAQLDGPFEFSNVRAAGAGPEAPAWIDAHGCAIRGALLGDGAQLRAPPPRPRNNVQRGHQRYALRLSDAFIDGSVYLNEKFSACGGITFSAAHIRGDVVAVDARVEEGEGDALRAQATLFDGVVMLDGLAARGRVWMLGAKIRVSLQLSRANLDNRIRDDAGSALEASGIEIGSNLYLQNGFRARGGVSFWGAKIGGSMDCGGARLSNHTPDGGGVALSADGIVVEGTLNMAGGFAATGQISLAGAKIGRDLDCNGAIVRNDKVHESGDSLVLSNASVGRNLQLNNVVSIGRLSLWACQIGGNLNCDGAKLVAWTSNSEPAALYATNLVVGGDVFMDNAEVIGWLRFDHAQISGSLRWDGVQSGGLRFPASLRQEVPVEWKGQVRQAKTTWSYSGRVRRGAAPPVSTAPTGGKHQAKIVLAHAQIGAALQAYHLHAEVSLLVDLSAARTYTLDDDKSQGDRAGGIKFPAGWGGEGAGAPELDLDGFVYQRIEHFPVPDVTKSGIWRFIIGLLEWLGTLLEVEWQVLGRPLLAPMARTRLGRSIARAWRNLGKEKGGEDIAIPRLGWLGRQYLNREAAFYPQPYRHLAAVLRAQGHAQAARTVAIKEGDRTPYGFWGRFLRPLWGRCFGYGLAPFPASFTLIVVLGLGWATVWMAWEEPWMSRDAAWSHNNRPVLVITPERIEALGNHTASPALRWADIQCGKTDIQPFFYALDMMLPVVSLHQEERCEVAARPGMWWWQVVWAVYSIIGKIVASLALITYSGVLKPKDD